MGTYSFHNNTDFPLDNFWRLVCFVSQVAVIFVTDPEMTESETKIQTTYVIYEGENKKHRHRQ